MTTARTGIRWSRRPLRRRSRASVAATTSEHAELARESRVETRTVAITAGKLSRNWFETTVADEARQLGVELSIVEHPHLLSTQIAFTLTGPTGKVEQVIADMNARAGLTTRLETAYLTPI